jgi:mannose-6-phosphate isomerase-like protein (cupin superfamily)
MAVAQEKQPVGRGDAVLIPPGSWHCMTNTGDGDLTFLCCCSPAYRHDDTELQTSQRGDYRGIDDAPLSL